MHNFMALRMTNTTGVIYAAIGSGLVDDALFSASRRSRDPLQADGQDSKRPAPHAPACRACVRTTDA